MSTTTSAPQRGSRSTSTTSRPASRKGLPTLPAPEQRNSARRISVRGRKSDFAPLMGHDRPPRTRTARPGR
eukprot:12741261-Alexandrium_andersonii.AAC.1